MKLYHFTSNLHLWSVLKNGLISGVIPTNVISGVVSFEINCQWLTKNGCFNQSWNESTTLSYNRTANRLTIEIPLAYTVNLIKWTDYCKTPTNNAQKETFRILNSDGDPENWYIYKGHIPPEWITEVVKGNNK
jgi:hypothetical protein